MPNKRTSETSDEIIKRYKRKIKHLEENQKRRRIWIESSSDSEETSSQTESKDPDDIVNTQAVTQSQEPTTSMACNNEQGNSTGLDLDPELLMALGEEGGSVPKFGEKIHQSLARRWEPILKGGLGKDVKEKLLKDHLVPENCTLLQAPKLNKEVAAAISEASRHRDKRKEIEQQQLGVGISVISKALSLLLTGDNKIEAIKIITDGCRILNDLHYEQTQARINVINYALSKPFLNVIQDGERDDTLYGNNLAEKIKATKAIEKQGLSIKKVNKTQKTTSAEQPVPSTTRPNYQYGQSGPHQGNWSGPPRYTPQNRGGRRGLRRPNVPGRRLPSHPSSGANKQRGAASRH